MNEEYSSKFIYKPPNDLQNEFVSSIPIRFLTESKPIKKQIECLDCDAKSLAFALEEMNFEDEKLETMKEAILFILWNTDWPVGD